MVTFNYKIIVWVRLHCKPSGLKCEMIVMPLEWVLGRDRVVSELIPDPGVGVCLALSIWPRNPMGHNEDVVSAWGGVCDVPHRIGEKVLGAIYVEVPLNQVDAF